MDDGGELDEYFCVPLGDDESDQTGMLCLLVGNIRTELIKMGMLNIKYSES